MSQALPRPGTEEGRRHGGGRGRGGGGNGAGDSAGLEDILLPSCNEGDGGRLELFDNCVQAGLGLACLFMTVLGFDNITYGYCLMQVSSWPPSLLSSVPGSASLSPGAAGGSLGPGGGGGQSGLPCHQEVVVTVTEEHRSPCLPGGWAWSAPASWACSSSSPAPAWPSSQ